ncbi:conserved protein of unknown function [Acetoanaerobium sticklandii]|uniref:Uncharacterized protein n=1 Tax=Acetoanaerobium sticklandii (strain ATCC 12662 / DSM 519 / JCM 1433 / CCUG 9281 / NCIMB 10654 / HF) TaxID=499177 RepID=E3PVF3_ACESD|nr:hypothetical protein [Acetoanaerobium sticklandii]CBH20520.1 conserved protein of unknown function [Acetoanaerobium sticklandii]
MKVIQKDSISKSLKKYNEDISYIGDSWAWVIDGATGLSGRNLLKDKTDASWFVYQWNEYLISNIKNYNFDLSTIIKLGIESIYDKYRFLVKKEEDLLISPIDFPSATIALIRWNSNHIEYFLLGDCEILIQNGQTNLVHISDEALKPFDDKVIDLMTNEKIINGLTHDEARDKATSMLVEHRLMKNKPKGYWSLEFDDIAVDMAKKGKICLDQEAKCLLMSDGFSILFQKYLKVDKYKIINFVEKNGLVGCYNLLRDIESNDSECIRYPRLKKSDDSSAVFIRFF